MKPENTKMYRGNTVADTASGWHTACWRVFQEKIHSESTIVSRQLVLFPDAQHLNNDVSIRDMAKGDNYGIGVYWKYVIICGLPRTTRPWISEIGRVVFAIFMKVGPDDFCESRSLSVRMHANFQFHAIT
jgi:hypothetical protein